MSPPWRKRLLEQRLMGLYDEVRPGRPRSIDDEHIMDLLKTTPETEPADGATHWSCRSAEKATSISKSTVSRVRRAFGVQPHRQKHIKLSNDPLCVEKAVAIVWLCLNSTDGALELCVDAKSQCQALERTPPMLPLGPGYLDGVTHSCVRQRTTTLFAALDIATGKVPSKRKPRHRHQERLQCLRYIDASVPLDLDSHLVPDRYCTHKHAKVRRWLSDRPRYHVYYTPTHASWPNQVEIWFNVGLF